MQRLVRQFFLALFCYSSLILTVEILSLGFAFAALL